MQKQQKVRNVNVAQNYIEAKTLEIQNTLNLQSKDNAYQILVASALFDLSYEDIAPEEIVDGRQDKQIDIIHIDDQPDDRTAHIHIIQTKNTRGGFSSNALIQLQNGLYWVFEADASNLNTVNNRNLVIKIEEIRQLWFDYGTSNLDVSVYFVTNGDAMDLSDEFIQQKQIIEQHYNGSFHSFTANIVGANEIVEHLNQNDRAGKKINESIQIVYDQNQASLIEYTVGTTKAVICTVTGKELARLSNSGIKNSIFELNLRPYQGMRGDVNTKIRSTAIGDDSPLFWFLQQIS